MNHTPLLQRFLTGSEFQPLLSSNNVERHRAQCKALVRQLCTAPPASSELAAQFHDRWHACHHHVRQLVDDDESLLEMLSIWLPRYQGPELTLFRGENTERYQTERTGTAWTDRMATAIALAARRRVHRGPKKADKNRHR